jgi:hypothetical protein
MNLIEISEQLKDVPDQLLMKEVQAPSGAYPAYLVVTEMSRRKRMRDQAVKEAPTSTVAQDLSQPSREQLMAAMAAMQRGPEAPPEMPMAPPMPRQAQGMSQPAPRLNAPGIMAVPQASQALAAQDVMGAQEPRRMAAGGMVAFAEGGMPKYDSRGAVLFQNQGVVPRYGMRFEDLPEYRTPPASSLGEMFGNFFTRPGQRVDPYTNEPIYIGEFLRRQERARADAAAPIGRAIVENTVRANPQAAINMAISNPAGAAELAQRDPIVAQHLRNAQMNPGGQNVAAAAPPANAPPRAQSNPNAPGGGNTRVAVPQVNLGTPPSLTISPFVDPYAADAAANLTALRAFKEPTPQELERARAAEETRYGEKVPFRYGFLEKDIAKREKDMEGRKSSNINEALIQTGLGIMGSKSPRFLQAAGEAGTAGLNAYRQGLKDIREGERDILQSKTAFANAQTLYDQGKFTAGEKAEEKANKTYERGLNRLNTESAILARNQNQAAQIGQLNQQGQVAQFNAGIAALGAQREAAKLPYELAALREQAGYYSRMPNAYGGAGAAANRLSDADQNKAEEAARTRALMSGKPFGSAEYQALYNQYYAEELQRRGAGINYQPPSGAASTQGGGALPPGWSVQVQPAR